MMIIENKTFDNERALYGSRGLMVKGCSFDGPADGESAFKECKDIVAEGCYFNLRYPFWHDSGLVIRNSEMTPLCRAALWYSENITVLDTKLHGIKALRECKDISIEGCDIVSPEFGWFSEDISIRDTSCESEYFMLRSKRLDMKNVRLKGKYSFQYIEDSVFTDCVFDTKDAFWHAKNVTVRDSVINGEYLAWYCENVTFINCRIRGTQPLCYCKGLKLVDCIMEDADLCFERSETEAALVSPVISIKDPLKGRIVLPYAEEIIIDGEGFDCEIVETEKR